MKTLLLGFIWNLGPIEIGVILLVALLLFGRRLPEVARSLGQGLVEFRKGLRDDTARPRPLPDLDVTPREQDEADPPEEPPHGESPPETLRESDEEERLEGEPEASDLAG